MAENVTHEHHHKMTQEEKDSIAQEKFHKPFDQLETDEKKSVGGTFRAKELGHEGYSAMGHMGGEKGGYSTGYAHDPKKQAEAGATSYYGSDEQGGYDLKERGLTSEK